MLVTFTHLDAFLTTYNYVHKIHEGHLYTYIRRNPDINHLLYVCTCTIYIMIIIIYTYLQWKGLLSLLDDSLL